MYPQNLHSLRQFLRLAENKIPTNIKIVAELRLIWTDIVGEAMSKRSQPTKCEYISTDSQNQQDFKRRLVVHTLNNETLTALTTYASEYLEKIPKKYRIHSLRFYQTKTPFTDFTKQAPPTKPTVLISEKDKQDIVDKVTSLHMSEETSSAMINYLLTWKNLQNKKNNDR